MLFRNVVGASLLLLVLAGCGSGPTPAGNSPPRKTMAAVESRPLRCGAAGGPGAPGQPTFVFKDNENDSRVATYYGWSCLLNADIPRERIVGIRNRLDRDLEVASADSWRYDSEREPKEVIAAGLDFRVMDAADGQWLDSVLIWTAGYGGFGVFVADERARYCLEGTGECPNGQAMFDLYVTQR